MSECGGRSNETDGTGDVGGVDPDYTICAEHRDGKPGEPHEWRRGRRGRTRVVTCHPEGSRRCLTN